MKILIIRLSSIGDIVLTEPILRHLREQVPNATIDYLTKERFIPLVKYFERINIIIPYTSQNQAIRILKKNRYDIIIDLHSKPRTWLLRLLVPAKNKVAYNKRHLLRWLIVKKVIRREIDSTVRSYLSVFRKLDMIVPDKFHYPRIKATKRNDYLIKKLRKEIDAKDSQLVAIFPGALHQTKRYPVEQFADFINHFTDNGERFRFVLMGSQEDQESVAKLSNLCLNKPINWCDRFDLDELVKVISIFDLVITNDSGPMHIAAAAGIKQIAIFGATHPSLGFRPLNKKSLILQVKLPCRPCSLHGGKKCPHQHFLCMRSLLPEMLEEGVHNIINDNASGNSDHSPK
jgi:lipopolysaccharide heptosyltransferase II